MTEITDTDIKALALEAAAAGDHATVVLCKRALGKRPGESSEEARLAVEATIRAARAQ
jgi:hypothetical protein